MDTSSTPLSLLSLSLSPSLSLSLRTADDGDDYSDLEKLRRKFAPAMTVFSAPNYCGRYGNKAAFVSVVRLSLSLSLSARLVTSPWYCSV